MPLSPRMEFSKSKSDLTFVAMSPTSIGERQLCLFNKTHILFSVMSLQRGSRSSLAVMSSKTMLMKRHNCATYQSTRQSGGKGTHTLLHIHSHSFACLVLRESSAFLMDFTICALFLKCSKRLSAASRKASFTILPSLNGFPCLERT